MSDPGLLALVIDDPLAPKLLAWWKAKKPTLAEAPMLLSTIARVTRADSLDGLRDTIERCELAGLLVDGGISEIAERWLGAHIGSKLGMRPKSDGYKAKYEAEKKLRQQLERDAKERQS